MEEKPILSPLGSYPNITSLWAHTIFGQWTWAWQWVRNQASLSCRGCCLLRAGPPGRAGWAEVPVAPACSVWRWRGGEKFHRSADAGELECKPLTSAAAQQPSWSCAVTRSWPVWEFRPQVPKSAGETTGIPDADTSCKVRLHSTIKSI